MTVSTTDCRADVIDRLVELLQAHPNLTGVTVEPEHPGDTIGAESLYLVSVEGDSVEIPVMTAGRKVRDDYFKLTFLASVLNRGDYVATRQRVTELVAAIEDVVADDPTLDGDPGSLVSIEVSNKNGPDVLRSDQGRLGMAQVIVSCHTRLT